MAESVESRNQMGYLACTSYVVGNIVGSGIFITPTTILIYTNSVGLSLVIWAVCALISILGAICYIELGTSIPEPGCDFAYTCFVGWHAVAFSFMWVSCVVTYPASAAVQAQTFGQYLVTGISPLVSIEHPWDKVIEYGLGFLLLIALTFLNFYSIERVAARFQIVVTVAKVLIVGIIIFTGFYYLIFKGWSQNLEHPFRESDWSPGHLSLALYGGLWSYAGWDVLNYGTPEIKNPRRNMPLALLSGIFIVASIYVLINVSYFVVLSPEQMKNSTAVAADFANIALGNFSYAVPFMIAILLIGTLNSNIFCGSRFMHAASRRGQLPPFLSAINVSSNSPRAALLGQLVCSIIVSFIDVNKLINYVTFVMWGQRVVTASALLYLRWRRLPVDSGAIRIPLILTVAFFGVSCALVVVPFVEEPQVTLVGLGFVVVGLIFYILIMWKKRTWECCIKLNDVISRFTCYVLNCELDLVEDKLKVSEEERRLSNAAEDEEECRETKDCR